MNWLTEGLKMVTCQRFVAVPQRVLAVLGRITRGQVRERKGPTSLARCSQTPFVEARYHCSTDLSACPSRATREVPTPAHKPPALSRYAPQRHMQYENEGYLDQGSVRKHAPLTVFAFWATRVFFHGAYHFLVYLTSSSFSSCCAPELCASFSA